MYQPLAAEFALGTPLGNLFVAVVILFVVAFVGRLLLALAWRVLLIAAIAIGVLYLLSLAVP